MITSDDAVYRTTWKPDAHLGTGDRQGQDVFGLRCQHAWAVLPPLAHIDGWPLREGCHRRQWQYRAADAPAACAIFESVPA